MSAQATKKQKTEEHAPHATYDQSLHRRTLRFAVSLAVENALPNRTLMGGHAIGEAYWYRLCGKEASIADVDKIRAALTELVNSKAVITPGSKGWMEAHTYFSKSNLPKAAKLLETRVSREVNVHSCQKSFRLRHTPLVGDLGQLSQGPHEIRICEDGFLAIWGDNYEDQPAIFESFRDHLKWTQNTFEVFSVGDLNALTATKGEEGRKTFAMAAEFRQDQKLTQIARIIHERNSTCGPDEQVRVMAIAGPTSSGKTTFAHKLGMYLKNYGYPTKELSVDHYYLNLEDQPKFKIRKERKDVDYDHIESMDIPLVSDHITRLIKGEKVNTPVYDFKSGNRVPPGHEMTLHEAGILIIEGIHALNPEYTAGLNPNHVFKIYISPLVCLQVDDHNVMKSTYHRLLRRMTRDYKFRGYSAEHTLSKWGHVRRGEHMHIFKHQNNADFVMNSAMENEIAVLKSETEPLLKMVPPTSDQFEFAQEVLMWLECVSGWPEREISYTSIFREFIGNGAYDKH